MFDNVERTSSRFEFCFGQHVSTKIHQSCSTNVASCRRGFRVSRLSFRMHYLSHSRFIITNTSRTISIPIFGRMLLDFLTRSVQYPPNACVNRARTSSHKLHLIVSLRTRDLPSMICESFTPCFRPTVYVYVSSSSQCIHFTPVRLISSWLIIPLFRYFYAIQNGHLKANNH